MKNANHFTYYDQCFESQCFKPIIGIFYNVLIEGKETPLQIEFTNETVHEEEDMMGFNCFECWDEEETRYVYYSDRYGNHYMKTKNIDDDVIEFTIKSITNV